METAIEVDSVKYVYHDGTLAIDDVNLEITKGQRVAILGPNGAGKSTLLLLLGGLIEPSQGSVKIHGLQAKGKTLAEIRKHVGIVFQHPDDQLFCPTLWEDVAFGPSNMGLSEAEVETRVKEALDIVGMTGYENKAPHHLSLGQKRKAAIATVLSMRPEMLLLDEPLANLDPKSRLELIKFLNKLHETQGITIILALNDMDQALALSDHAYVLEKGKIVAEGTPREIALNHKLLHDANLEPPLIAHFFAHLEEKTGLHSALETPLTFEDGVNHIVDIVNRKNSRSEK